MSVPKYDFKVSVEGNKLYEIRTGLGVSRDKFSQIIGCHSRYVNFCECVTSGKPLGENLQRQFPNKVISDTVAKRISSNLGLAVEDVFPMYEKCRMKFINGKTIIKTKAKSTPKKIGKPQYDFMVDVRDNRLCEIRTNLGLKVKDICALTSCDKMVINFCEHIAFGRPLPKRLSESYHSTKISNTTAERIAQKLQLPVGEVFPRYNECAEKGKRVFPFDTIDDRNAAIEAFYPRIDEMVKMRWWNVPHCDLEEFRDVAQLTVVELADKIYRRGLPTKQGYRWNGTDYTGIDGYFIKAIRFSWLNTQKERKKIPIYSFNHEEETNNWLFEKMLYNSTERII